MDELNNIDLSITSRKPNTLLRKLLYSTVSSKIMPTNGF